MPANFSVRTRSTLFTNDQDGDGIADAGDVLRTTLTFENVGDDALDVTVQDLLNGSTLVPGSVKIGPMAVDDAATISGNTPQTFTFAQLLGNDIDPDGSAANLTITGVSGAVNGTVTIDLVGETITFTPNTGFTGAASFQYSVADADGLTNVAGYEGTVDVTVDGLVWYVDANYGGANGAPDGSYLRPFTSLTPLNDDGTVGTGRVGTADGIAGNQDVDGAGDTIFVYDRGNAAYNGGITLEAGQKLFGDSHSFVVNGLTIGASGNQSTINSHSVNNTNYGVTLSTNNEIRGINLDGDNNGTTNLRDGNGTVGSLTITDSSISGSGQAVDIDQGGALNVTLTSLSSSGSAAEGVHLAGTGANLLTGSFTANAGTIQNSTGTGFLIGQAGGGTASSGGSANITYNGNITNPGGSLVEIQDRTGGTVTFGGQLTEGAIGDGQTGILLDGNAGTINFNGQTFVSAGAGTTGNGVTLTNNSGTINFNATGTGLDITTTSGTGLTFTGGGTLNITGAANSVTTTTGQVLNLQNGAMGTSGIAFQTLTSGTVASGHAININNLDAAGAGTFSGGAVTIGGTAAAGADGINITNSNSTFTFSSATIDNTQGDGIEINGQAQTQGAVTFTTVNIDGTTGSGVEIVGNSNAVNINGGTIGATNDANAETVLINGGNGNITINAALTNNTANVDLIDISNRTGGTVAFGGNLSSTGGAGGIDIANSAGTVNFTGSQITLTTGGNAAVNITNNSAAINFTGGSLDITTTGGAGLSANATGGSVTVTGNSNTVSTGTGTAVDIRGTDIGAAGVTFATVNTNGAVNGIILANTGSGGFTASGGSILNSLGHGIDLTNVSNISLTGVTITGSGGSGIRGSGVNNLSLTNVTSSNNGNAIDEDGVFLVNASGHVVVTNSTFNANADDNFAIRNDTGSLNVTITGSTFSNSYQGALGDDNLIIQANDSANVTALISGNTFTNAEGDHFQFATNQSATGSSHITFTNNILSNNQPSSVVLGSGVTISPAGSADLRALISGNTITDTIGGYAFNVNAIDTTSSAELDITIQNNTIGANGVAGSGPEQSGAIQGRITGSGTMDLLIDNNDIFDFGSGSAIDLSSAAGVINGSNSIMNATVINNFVADGTAFAQRAFLVGAGASSGTHNNIIRLRLSNNDFDGNFPGGSANDLRATVFSNAQIQSPGYAGGGADPVAFVNHIIAQNGVAGVTGNGAVGAGVTNGFANTPGGANPPLPSTPNLPPPPIMLAPEPPADTGTGKGEGHSGDIPPPIDDGDTANGSGGTGGKGDGHAGDLPTDNAHPVIVDDNVLSQAELDYLVDAAIQRWIDAGASAEQVAAMRAANFSVADMTGVQLGMSDGANILIDNDGGRAGWFLDTTPDADEEYAGSGTRLTATGGAAAEGVDLLTVLMHELGHQAGLGDHYNLAARDDLMYGYAYEGERRLPADGQAAGAVPGSIPHPVFQLGPVVVGTVPGDNAFVVQYDSVVNALPGEDRLVQYFSNSADISWRDVPAGTLFSASTNAELLAVDSLSLGDSVFFDVNQNGVFDSGTDLAVAGVSLTLFADTNNNGVYDEGIDEAISYLDNDSSGTYDPAVDTPVAAGTPGAIALTVTTDATGAYAFNYLAPGDYIVRVDASNFLSGGPLEGLVSASVVVPAPDPNNNVNGDNNGQAFSGYAATRSIRLDFGLEPDGDTNNTLDLGFVATNDAPVNSVPGLQSFGEDGTLTFNAANGNLISVSDPDVGAGNLSVTLSIETGALTLSGTAGLTVTGNGTNNVTLTGTQAAINTALDGLVYNPGANYNGDRILTITTNDNGNTGVDPGLTGDSTSEEDTDTIAIDVTSINDAPVVIGDGTVDADPIVEDTPTGGQTVNALFSAQYSDAADAQFSVSNPGGSSPGSFSGIAVVANGSSGATGQWQYFNSNTSTWVDIGARSTASALLIGSGTAIRFNPALDFTGTAPTLTVNLIDNSLGFGITFGQVVDISGVGATGGSTAYSTGTVVLSQEVVPANIAPVLDLDADDSNSVGTGYAGAYTEGGAAVAISDTDVSITDADAGDDIVSATITIANAEAGDLLTVGTLPATVTVDPSSTATNVILVAAPGTSAADFEAAIEAVTYSNTGDNPTDFGTNTSRTITVTVNDGGDDSNVATATIAVTDVNDAPSGTSSTITAIEDVFRLIEAADLGFNDADGTLASVTISAVTGGGLYFDADGTAGAGVPVLVTTFPATYTAQDLADGKVSFRADPNANGAAIGTITFAVTDDDGATDSTSNTLTVDVTAVNDTPVLTTGGPIAATEQTAVAILPAGAVADVDLDARNGGLGDYAGATFSVNRNPVANAEDLFSLVAGPNFTIDGNQLKAGGQVFATFSTGLAGTIVVNFTSAQTIATSALVDEVIQAVRYTNGSDNPPASVQLAVGFTDGSPGGGQGAGASGLDVNLVTVNIAAVNDAPVNSLGGTIGTGEDAIDAWLSGMSISDPDADPATDLVTVTFNVQNGTLDIRTDVVGGVTAGGVTGDDTDTITVTATLNQINATLAAVNGLTYSPDPDFFGNDTLTVTTNDQGANGSGGALTDIDTRTIIVSPQPDAPVAQPDAISTLENVIGTGSLFANNGSGPDVDVDGDAIVISEVNGSAANVGVEITLASGAKLTVNADGTYSYNPNGKFTTLTDNTSGAVNTSTVGDTFQYTVAGGNTVTVTVTVNGVAGPGDWLMGDGTDNVINGTALGDLFLLQQGGDDTATGMGGADGFYFGGAYDVNDIVHGNGGRDQLGLQGDYSGGVTLGTITGIEDLILLSGAITRFGDTANNFYDYNITTQDSNVAAGQTLLVDGVTLRAGEDLTFDGSAETDGNFLIYAGMGVDHLTGGMGNDGFLFRGGGHLTGADTVNGGAGSDHLGLRGDYTGGNAVTFNAGSMTGIEVIVVLSGQDLRFGPAIGPCSYEITMHDANVLAGQRMIIDAATLRPDESLSFDGSAESDGSFRIVGGGCDDILIGSQNDDLITGALGADLLIGGGGNDRFIYRSVLESDPNDVPDFILDFSMGDLVDLSAIDANTTLAGNQAFVFIDDNAFTGQAGQLRSEDLGGGNWVVQADIDGDGVSDFDLLIFSSDMDAIASNDFVM